MTEQTSFDHLDNVVSQSVTPLPGDDQPSPAPTPEGSEVAAGTGPYANPSPPDGVPAAESHPTTTAQGENPPQMNPPAE